MPLDVGAAHHAVKFSFAHVLHNLAYKVRFIYSLTHMNINTHTYIDPSCPRAAELFDIPNRNIYVYILILAAYFVLVLARTHVCFYSLLIQFAASEPLAYKTESKNIPFPSTSVSAHRISRHVSNMFNIRLPFLQYSRHEDESDVIDLKRLKVVENNGTSSSSCWISAP